MKPTQFRRVPISRCDNLGELGMATPKGLASKCARNSCNKMARSIPSRSKLSSRIALQRTRRICIIALYEGKPHPFLVRPIERCQMSRTISLDAIREHLPHVDVDNLAGRPLPLHCLLSDDGEWLTWIPDGNDGLHKIIATPVEACYFGKQPENENDIRLFFIEFLDQRANYPECHSLARAAYSDVQNLATSLAKLELIFSARNEWSGTSRMAATELEYIFVNCRSLFDVFQELIVKLWGKIKLLDESLSKRNLPSSFRRMVLHADKKMTVDKIVSKHQIPKQIAEAYYATSPFFEWLREYRDYIAHSGKDFDRVFRGESGFAVSIDEAPFSHMAIWCDANTLPNNLGSLKSAACHIILTTLQSLESIIIAFQSVIQCPPPVAPDHAIFIRGPNIGQLATVEAGIEGSPWYAVNVSEDKDEPCDQPKSR